MTTIGSTSFPSRYQDRAAYAQWAAERSRGQYTLEEITKQNDEADLSQLHAAESEASYARGEAIIVGVGGGNVSVELKMHDQPHPEIYDHRIQYYPDGRPIELNALNTDFVVENQEKLYGHDLQYIAYYAEYLQKSFDNGLKQDSNYTFNGYSGTDRVTHDVNEYIGWLYERAGIEPPASTSDVKLPPTIEGAIDYDPAVLERARRLAERLDSAGAEPITVQLDTASDQDAGTTNDTVSTALEKARMQIMEAMHLNAPSNHQIEALIKKYLGQENTSK